MPPPLHGDVSASKWRVSSLGERGELDFGFKIPDFPLNPINTLFCDWFSHLRLAIGAFSPSLNLLACDTAPRLRGDESASKCLVSSFGERGELSERALPFPRPPGLVVLRTLVEAFTPNLRLRAQVLGFGAWG